MVTYAYRRGLYLTLLDGRVEEAHKDLVEFLESIRDFTERAGRRAW